MRRFESPIATQSVLVVDDSSEDRAWLIDLLRESRQFDEVLVADSLGVALDIVARTSPDLVITDDSLHDGKALELATHPTLLARHTPVIVITGQEQPNQGTSLLGRGAADFLPKDDLTARALARACSHALVRAKLEAEIESSRAAERAAHATSEAALADARRALSRVAALQKFTAALGTAQTPANVVEAALRERAVFEHALAGRVFERSGSALLLRTSFGHERDQVERWRSLPLSLPSPTTEAVKTARAVLVHDREELRRRYGELPVDQDCWVAVPLMREHECMGVLDLCFETLPDPGWLDYLHVVTRCLTDAVTRARLYEQTQRAVDTEQQLLAIVGHDLRTPLSAITLGVNILRSEQPNNSILARIERSARSMSELIRDILNRAEVRRGREEERLLRMVETERALQEQLEELRAAFPNSQLELSVLCPSDDRCDAVRMSQLVTNLVRNAIQHGDSSAPVRIRYQVDDEHALLSVHNLGQPIPKEQLSELFDPFARGRKSRGTGLGLFIVHESVRELGGEVGVESGEQGTTFTLRLPRGCWQERSTQLPPPPAR